MRFDATPVRLFTLAVAGQFLFGVVIQGPFTSDLTFEATLQATKLFPARVFSPG